MYLQMSLEKELIEKNRLEEEFNRDIDQMISRFENEALEERKLKEEEKRLKEAALKEIEELKKLLDQKS
jgi:hypothetical protein